MTSPTGAKVQRQQAGAEAAVAHSVVMTVTRRQTSAGAVLANGALLRVTVLDGSGRPLVIGEPLTATLTSSSSSGSFSGEGSVVIAAGSSGADVEYRDTAAGRPTLSVAVSGLVGSSALVQVDAGPAAGPSDIQAALPARVGQTIQMTSIAVDGFGNAVGRAGMTWQIYDAASSEVIVAAHQVAADDSGHSTLVYTPGPEMAGRLLVAKAQLAGQTKTLQFSPQ